MAKGKKTGGGSRKGRPNIVYAKTREELWAEIEQRCARGEAANPFLAALDMMCTSEDERLRLQAAEFLGDRLLPKLKAVEHSGDPDKPIVIEHYEVNLE